MAIEQDVQRQCARRMTQNGHSGEHCKNRASHPKSRAERKHVRARLIGQNDATKSVPPVVCAVSARHRVTRAGPHLHIFGDTSSLLTISGKLRRKGAPTVQPDVLASMALSCGANNARPVQSASLKCWLMSSAGIKCNLAHNLYALLGPSYCCCFGGSVANSSVDSAPLI